MSFTPLQKKLLKSFYFLFFILSKVNLFSSQKIVGYICGVFSFGGTLGWDPAPDCPPPLKPAAGSAGVRSAGGSRECQPGGTSRWHC